MVRVSLSLFLSLASTTALAQSNSYNAEITGFSTPAAFPGDVVSVYGRNFDAYLNPIVAFAGIPGNVRSVSPTEIVVEVPASTSGPVRVSELIAILKYKIECDPDYDEWIRENYREIYDRWCGENGDSDWCRLCNPENDYWCTNVPLDWTKCRGVPVYNFEEARSRADFGIYEPTWIVNQSVYEIIDLRENGQSVLGGAPIPSGGTWSGWTALPPITYEVTLGVSAANSLSGVVQPVWRYPLDVRPGGTMVVQDPTIEEEMTFGGGIFDGFFTQGGITYDSTFIFHGDGTWQWYLEGSLVEAGLYRSGAFHPALLRRDVELLDPQGHYVDTARHYPTDGELAVYIEGSLWVTHDLR